jgi:hypothetical protein
MTFTVRRAAQAKAFARFLGSAAFVVRRVCVAFFRKQPLTGCFYCAGGAAWAKAFALFSGQRCFCCAPGVCCLFSETALDGLLLLRRRAAQAKAFARFRGSAAVIVRRACVTFSNKQPLMGCVTAPARCSS